MYYTYELVDPRCGSVFYIGKGKDQRRFHHVKEAKAGAYSRKCDRIREILTEGLEPESRIIEHFSDEAEAYEAERLAIERFGLDNLTNVMPGGGGCRVAGPFVWTIDELKRLAGTVAKVLVILHRGQRFMVAQVDITETVQGLIDRLITDVGDKAFADAVRPHGVEVQYGGA